MSAAQAVFDIAYQHCLFFLGFIAFTVLLSFWARVYWKQTGESFAFMTWVWALINLALATLLLDHIHVPSPDKLEYTYTHIRKWLTINLFLDLIYALCGFIMLRPPSRWKVDRIMLVGFGKAVLLQSLGLFIIDLIFLVRL